GGRRRPACPVARFRERRAARRRHPQCHRPQAQGPRLHHRSAAQSTCGEPPYERHRRVSAPIVAFVATDTEPAQVALAELTRRYGAPPLEQADIIVALGGDGFMLETLHRTLERGVPIYGMHRGT